MLASQLVEWATEGQSHWGAVGYRGEHASGLSPQGTRKVEGSFTHSPSTIGLKLLPEALTLQHSGPALLMGRMWSNKKCSQDPGVERWMSREHQQSDIQTPVSPWRYSSSPGYCRQDLALCTYLGGKTSNLTFSKFCDSFVFKNRPPCLWAPTTFLPVSNPSF